MYNFSNISVPATIRPGEQFTIEATITNTANFAITQPRWIFEVVRPFEGINYVATNDGEGIFQFAAGESRRVSLTVDLEEQIFNTLLPENTPIQG